MSFPNSVRPSLLPLLVFFSLFSACATGSGSEDSSSRESDFSSAVETLSTESSLVRDEITFCGTRDTDNDTNRDLLNRFTEFVANGGLSERRLLRNGDITIPIIYHVISSGPELSDGEVPDAMLIEQTDILNRGYSGELGGVSTPFRFETAGINRVRNAEWHVMSPGSDSELKAKEALKQGGLDTLNVFVVNIQADLGPDREQAKMLGYATLPILNIIELIAKYDGVVLNFETLPGSLMENYNIGHVLIHEVGHWLGLFHTFLGQCDGILGDLILDTPREKTPELGNYCPVDRDSCPGGGLDPIHNHMTYTGDSCRFEFTQNQVDFMLFNSSVFRGL